ncbi:MAG: hypothetical protein ACJ76Z_03765 [Thermoleophilaceae bacterium]
MKSKIFNYGGVVAAAILIAFGIGAVVMGINGRDTVRSSINKEAIVGTPDMTPTAIAAEAKKAGLKNVDIPSTSVAGHKIDTGGEAKTFAQYMRIHALEATGGQVYSQMGRFLTKDGKPTNDETAAAVDSKTGKPVENGARNLWVTETALSTALNTSYFAENVANFAIVMGVALLLTGIGFLVLTLGLVRVPFSRTKEADRAAPAATAVPVAS